jgi:hypothetical protein
MAHGILFKLVSSGTKISNNVGLQLFQVWLIQVPIFRNVFFCNFGHITLSEEVFMLDLRRDLIMESFNFSFILFLHFINLFVFMFQKLIFLIDQILHQSNFFFELFKWLEHYSVFILDFGNDLGGNNVGMTERWKFLIDLFNVLNSRSGQLLGLFFNCVWYNLGELIQTEDKRTMFFGLVIDFFGFLWFNVFYALKKYVFLKLIFPSN